MSPSVEEPSMVRVPRAYVTSPIFAAKPTTQSRSVFLSDGTRYTIGGNLLDTGQHAPALDVRHLRLILVLLLFRQREFPPPTRITFSMNEACHHYASSQGGRYSRELMRIFEDLKNSCFEIQKPGEKDFFIYPILKDFRVRGKYRRRKPLSGEMQKELHLEYAELHEDFIPLLMETVHFDLAIFKQMTSPISQAIYAFIPSRATHRPKNDPFSITLTTLLRQIGAAVPKAKWERKRLFTQNKNSIISQLNGASTRTGILRATLTETADEEDYKILFWEEKVPESLVETSQDSAKNKPSVFLDLWIQSGGDKASFQKKITPLPELTAYELSLMDQARIQVEGNQRAFQIAKALIGASAFQECLGNCKADELEDRPPTKSQTARFIHRLKEDIFSPSKAPEKQGDFEGENEGDFEGEMRG